MGGTSFSADQRAVLERLEAKQSNIHRQFERGSDANTELMQAVQCRSYEDFVTFWTAASGRAEKEYVSRHQRGWRKWTRRTQSLGEDAAGFMKDFSPIVDLIKDCGAPFGGLAVGTLSLLFTIAGNKSRIENQIALVMARARERLPAFRMYQEIYNSNSELEWRFQERVMEAYATIVEVSVQCATYYTTKGYRRWIMAVFKPNKFQAIVQKLQASIEHVQVDCGDLLSQNIYKIKASNEELQQKAEDLQQRLTRLQADNNKRHLAVIKQCLDLQHWSLSQIEADISAHSAVFERERDNEDEIFEQMTQQRIQEFKSEETYVKWDAPGQSALLLVVGSNHESIDEGRRQCWLSPLATELAREGHRSGNLHAHHLFPASEYSSIHDVIPKVLLQLLHQKLDEACSGDRMDALLAEMSTYRDLRAGNEDEQKIQSLRKAAATIMSYFRPSETVYLVFDRIDRCDYPDRPDFLDMLSHFFDSAKCSVKVLAVMADTGWRISNQDLRKLRRTIRFLHTFREQRCECEGE